jgi:predicted nucleic acid-binding Zn ribbon protein
MPHLFALFTSHRTWVCAAAIMADEQVCKRAHIRQAAQDEHI